ncbi:MAG: hypothetical protein K0B02_00935 [DPANN group archaeon]|nr:hypothetical protein [DPANN group archaeon]
MSGIQKRKAISPFIAAVFLIATTIFIGGFTATWIKDFSKTQTETVLSNTNTECNYVYLNPINPSLLNGTFSLIVQNTGTGSTTLSDIQIIYDNNTQLQKSLSSIELRGLEMAPISIYNVSSNIYMINIISDCKTLSIYSYDISFI